MSNEGLELSDEQVQAEQVRISPADHIDEHVHAQTTARDSVPDGDQDDVEGHGRGLNIALAGAIAFGSFAAGASVAATSTPLAPGATSASVPTPMPGPVPAAPGSAALTASGAETTVTSGG